MDTNFQRKVSVISSTSSGQSNSSVVINPSLNGVGKSTISSKVLNYINQDNSHLQDIYNSRMSKNFPPTNFPSDYSVSNSSSSSLPDHPFAYKPANAVPEQPTLAKDLQTAEKSDSLTNNNLKTLSTEAEIISVEDISESETDSDAYVTNTDGTGTGESSPRDFYSDLDSDESYDYDDDDEDDLLLPPSPPRSPPHEIDPDKLYGLYDFSGPDPSHLELERDEPVYLVNDQDNYWWLIRKMTKEEKMQKKKDLIKQAELKNEFIPDIESISSCSDDGKIGFVPAECLETYEERLARFNCFKNEEIERFQKNPFDFDIAQQIQLKKALNESTVESLPKDKSKRKAKNVKFNTVEIVSSEEEVSSDDDLSIIRQQQKQGINHDINHDDFSGHLSVEDKPAEVLSDVYLNDVPLVVKKTKNKLDRSLISSTKSTKTASNSINITNNNSQSSDNTSLEDTSSESYKTEPEKPQPQPQPQPFKPIRSLSLSMKPSSLSIPKRQNRDSKLSARNFLAPETSVTKSSTDSNLASKELPPAPDKKVRASSVGSTGMEKSSSKSSTNSNREGSPLADLKSTTSQKVSTISSGLKYSITRLSEKKEKNKLSKGTSLSSKVISASQGDLKHTNSLSKHYKDKLDNTPRRRSREGGKRIVNKNNGKIKLGGEEYPRFYRPIMPKLQSKDTSSIGSFSPDTPPSKTVGQFDSSPEMKTESSNLSQLRRSVILDRLTKMTSDIQEQLDDYDLDSSMAPETPSLSRNGVNGSNGKEASPQNSKSAETSSEYIQDLPTRRRVSRISSISRTEQNQDILTPRRTSRMDSVGSSMLSPNESVDTSSVHPRVNGRRESADHSVGSISRNASIDASSRNGKLDPKLRSGRRESVDSRRNDEHEVEGLRDSSKDHSYNPRPNGRRESFTRRDSNNSTIAKNSPTAKGVVNGSSKWETSFINNSMLSNGDNSILSQRSNSSKALYGEDILDGINSETPLTSVNSFNGTFNSPNGVEHANGKDPKVVHDMFLPILGKFDELAERLAELDDMI